MMGGVLHIDGIDSQSASQRSNAIGEPAVRLRPLSYTVRAHRISAPLGARAAGHFHPLNCRRSSFLLSRYRRTEGVGRPCRPRWNDAPFRWPWPRHRQGGHGAAGLGRHLHRGLAGTPEVRRKAEMIFLPSPKRGFHLCLDDGVTAGSRYGRRISCAVR